MNKTMTVEEVCEQGPFDDRTFLFEGNPITQIGIVADGTFLLHVLDGTIRANAGQCVEYVLNHAPVENPAPKAPLMNWVLDWKEIKTQSEAKIPEGHVRVFQGRKGDWYYEIIRPAYTYSLLSYAKGSESIAKADAQIRVNGLDNEVHPRRLVR